MIRPLKFDLKNTMKRTITQMMILVLTILVSLGFSTLQEEEKIHLKVTKEEDGEISVFEKVYRNMNDLKADEELKNVDLLVSHWSSDQGNIFITEDGENATKGKTVIIREKIDGDKEMIWIKDEGNEADQVEDQYVIKGQDGTEQIIEIKKEKKVINESEVDDEKETTFTYKIEGEGENQLMWKNEENENGEIRKEIKVITSDKGEGKKKVILNRGEGEQATEIDVEIEKEIGEDGKEKIVDKKVWITKDGKKVELDAYDAYEFETDGNKIKVKIDDEVLNVDDFSGGKFEGDRVLFFRDKGNQNEGIQQTMNVNIEEKNGEKFIEIHIKRVHTFNVTISELLKDDVALEEIDYSIKNNLKPAQLNYYPNPNNGKFNLKFVLDQKNEVTVKVMDILGNEAYKETILDFTGTYDNQIDLTGKEKGIYILQIIQKKKALSRKILIE